MLTLWDFSPRSGKLWGGGGQWESAEKPWGEGMCPFIPQPCCKHSCEGNINGQRRLFCLGVLIFFFFVFKATGLNIGAGQPHQNARLEGNPSNTPRGRGWLGCHPAHGGSQGRPSKVMGSVFPSHVPEKQNPAGFRGVQPTSSHSNPNLGVGSPELLLEADHILA